MTITLTLISSDTARMANGRTASGQTLPMEITDELKPHFDALISALQALDDTEIQRKQDEIDSRTEIIRQTIPFVEQSASDEQLLDMADIFPAWEDLIGEHMYEGRVFRHEGLLYKSRQDHTAQENWIPGRDTLAIYERVQLPPEEGEILPWVAGESVAVGDLREFEGIVYAAILVHTTQTGWEPPAAPALWKVYES